MAQITTIIPSAPPTGSSPLEFRQRLVLVQDVTDRIIYGPPDYVNRLRALNDEFNVGVTIEIRKGAELRVYPPMPIDRIAA